MDVGGQIIILYANAGVYCGTGRFVMMLGGEMGVRAMGRHFRMRRKVYLIEENV